MVALWLWWLGHALKNTCIAKRIVAAAYSVGDQRPNYAIVPGRSWVRKFKIDFEASDPVLIDTRVEWKMLMRSAAVQSPSNDD